MLKPQFNHSLPLLNVMSNQKPFIRCDSSNHSSSSAYFPTILRQHTSSTKKSRATRARLPYAATKIKAQMNPTDNINQKYCDIIIQPLINQSEDDRKKQQSFELEFISDKLSSKTVNVMGIPEGLDSGNVKYRCSIDVLDIGEIGAVKVKHNSNNKMFFKNILLETGVTFTCESWVHSEEPRTFFSDKSYIFQRTPEALKKLRNEEMVSLRGDNDKVERKSSDRIYDYDKYNDLGENRPVLGGVEHPYPRRCRTGRKKCEKDPSKESTNMKVPFYIPADEDFSEIRKSPFGIENLIRVLEYLKSALKDEGFPNFSEIDKLFKEGVVIESDPSHIIGAMPERLNKIDGANKAVIKFETPKTMARDKFSWLSDEEFCRQMLAGPNPCSIQLVTEWPLKSKLESSIYGEPECAITKDILHDEIKNFMTFDNALAEKKLFMLDYHDLLLPYVNKFKDHKKTTLYGSRTLMFLKPDGTLRPLAIELTQPPHNGKPQWKNVYTPAQGGTKLWLWRLAKAHVLAHDAAYHQLISHWLRTHCVTEPYIIATHRQLSQMHPMNRLLLPHFRYTMQINSLARMILISYQGVIESTFFSDEYSMQLSSDVYKQWRFDQEALPADLIRRGMAFGDPEGDITLTIKDYPYANDGLRIYDAIKEWVSSYVNHYYPEENLVKFDDELQAWWKEIKEVGHEDKNFGWPELNNQNDLIRIVSTIIWVTTGQHSAVNFGQYDFGGYIPFRPTVAKIEMPDPVGSKDEEWKSFIENPEDTLLKCFPSQLQSFTVLLLYSVLSSHSPNEEYIGGNTDVPWNAEPVLMEAFKKFHERLKKLEADIDRMNANPENKNRCGAGLVPYQLLKPYSDFGVTGSGVANSISI